MAIRCVPNDPKGFDRCYDICDFCVYYDFNGDKDGAYTGDGRCKLYDQPKDPSDSCPAFTCMEALKITAVVSHPGPMWIKEISLTLKDKIRRWYRLHIKWHFDKRKFYKLFNDKKQKAI